MALAPPSRSQLHKRRLVLALGASTAAMVLLLAWLAADHLALRRETARLRGEVEALRRDQVPAPPAAQPSSVATVPGDSSPGRGRWPDALVQPAADAASVPAPVAAGPLEQALRAQRDASSKAGASPFAGR